MGESGGGGKAWPSSPAAAPQGKALGSPRAECLSVVVLGAAGMEPFQIVPFFCDCCSSMCQDTDKAVV